MTSLLLSLILMAQPSDERENKAAHAAYQAGDYATAAQHWRTADKLRPRSKYALNVARMEFILERPVEAWPWLEVVKRRQFVGLTTDDVDAHTQIASDCRDILKKDHVLLRLVLSGNTASERIVVRRNGRPWAAPYVGWAPGNRSRLTIRVDNRTILDELWEHPVGKPANARHVAVPEVVVRDARPADRRERHTPAVVWNPSLESSATTGSNYGTAKWATLGVALALSGVGAGLYAHSFTLNSDIESLNTDFSDGTINAAEYHPKYDSLVADQGVFHPAGAALMAAGGAVMAASVVLFILDVEAGPTIEANAGTVVTGGFFRF